LKIDAQEKIRVSIRRTLFGSTIFTWLGATVIGTPLLVWNQLGVNKGTIAKSTTEDNAN